MMRVEPRYFATLDYLGQKTVNWMLDRHNADHVLGWYRQHGFDVRSPKDVERLPALLVEERVSRLREYWRRWLFGESAAALVVGPAGLVVGGPFLSLVLFAWSIEMGWAYGHNMADPRQIDHVRRLIHRRLMRALGFPHGGKGGWSRVIGTVMFWGFGPELRAADVVMAEIREEFRSSWESRHRVQPFTLPPM